MKDINFYTNSFWQMINCTTSRRELFKDGDRLKFTKLTDTRAELAVYRNDHLVKINEVLPSYIDFQLINGELIGAAYGRKKMVFRPRQLNANDQEFLGLSYEGDFINGPVHQPDEGGDGDPR